MNESSVRENDFEGMIREFENNIFKNNCDDGFSRWCFFRYCRVGEYKGGLLLDFSYWLHILLEELRPIKKLYWKIYPEIKYDGSRWEIFARFAVLRQTGKNVKGDIRYPPKAIMYGMLPMPDIGENRKEKA